MPATQMAARLGKTLQENGIDVENQRLTQGGGVGTHKQSVTFLWCRFCWPIEPVPDTMEQGIIRVGYSATKKTIVGVDELVFSTERRSVSTVLRSAGRPEGHQWEVEHGAEQTWCQCHSSTYVWYWTGEG